MNNQWHHQAIALAGLTQAIQLIDKLAKTGYLDQRLFDISIKSLFVTNPASISDIYEHTRNIKQGLEALREILSKGQSSQSAQLISYGLSVLHLQKKLSKNKKMLNTIGESLNTAKAQSEHFGLTHENVIANLADTYSKTISTFSFRIQVVGEPEYLQQTRTANRVRALLLAAIRAGTLWRQSGGSAWSLLFKRSTLIKATDDLLLSLTQQDM